MDQQKKLLILLSYMGFPITTARYFDTALRQDHNVLSVGAVPTQEFNKSQKVDLPSFRLDVITGLNPDILDIYNSFPDDLKPDLFLWIESVPGFFPENIKELPIPTACYFIDSHLNLDVHIKYARDFDHVFIAQREYLPRFTEAGIKSVHWLPLGADPEIHKHFTNTNEHEFVFIGSTGLNPRRVELLEKLKNNFDLHQDRAFLEKMAEEFSKGKIVFNSAVKNDLNMRVFETLSTGHLLLTDVARNSGQTELFVDGEDLAVYEDETLIETAKFYLANDELRETIARRGKEIIANAHTYHHRAIEIINLVTGKTLETPGAREWRERSVKNCTTSTKKINKLKRSFVIPVIDYSPASNFNIRTLLGDLENIEGNVIVIFNSKKVAAELKNHPRIDNYAILNRNVGVPRAWNIGLDMSATPVTFILNSDLHLNYEGVKILEKALISLPGAAMVGPQGSFNDIRELEDINYFDKGSLNEPLEVDAVSGFYFAVKTEYFHNCTLKFENKFTPCYFEEWDMGLQIKMAGLKSYVIPVTDYEHKFQGSIASMKEIEYYNDSATIHDVKLRNSKIFLEKWIAENEKFVKEGKTDFLVSKWLNLKLESAIELYNDGELLQAGKLFENIRQKYPGCKWAYYYLGMIAEKNSNESEIVKYYKVALEIDPSFQEVKERMKL